MYVEGRSLTRNGKKISLPRYYKKKLLEGYKLMTYLKVSKAEQEVIDTYESVLEYCRMKESDEKRREALLERHSREYSGKKL